MGKGRAPCCDKSKVKKGPWSPIEDLRLTTFIQNHGHDNWRALPKRAGLLRCGKSCRLRWINYLRPDVKRGNFTPEEELTIINLHNSIGNKWSKIASYLPGRTDNEIKNVWNTHLKKRLISKNSSTDDCHKSTKTNHSESASCTSSSSITSAGKQNVKKSLVDPGVAQESEMIKKRNKKTEFLIVKSTHPRDEEKSSSFDSPTSSYASNLDNRCNEALDFSKTEVMNPDDGKIEIPLESDIDFWELFDSVDQFHSAKTEDQNEQGSNHHAEKLGSGIECTKWLRFLETELGLTSDVDHLPKDQNRAPTSPQYRELNFEPEIGPGLDFFPIWPTSPQNLGI